MNDAVEIAHRRGILTAASLMVAGPAAADAVERARRTPTLRVGLHLAVIDADPTLPPERIPHLVDGQGKLRNDIVRLGVELVLSSAARRELRAEIDAQFAAFAATGLVLDHVNAHRHYHLHPIVGALLLDIGARYGMRALRAPREDAAVLRESSPTRVCAAVLRSRRVLCCLPPARGEAGSRSRTICSGSAGLAR